MLIVILDYIPVHSSWIFKPRSILLSVEALILSLVYCVNLFILIYALCKFLLLPKKSSIKLQMSKKISSGLYRIV